MIASSLFSLLDKATVKLRQRLLNGLALALSNSASLLAMKV